MSSQRRTGAVQDGRVDITSDEYTSADSVSVYCVDFGHWTFGFHLCICIDLLCCVYDLCKLCVSLAVAHV